MTTSNPPVNLKPKSGATDRRAPSAAGRSPAAELLHRLETKSATIGVIGLGYVGLPVARAIFDAGYSILGYDVDQAKIQKLNRGENYLPHLGDELNHMIASRDRFKATGDPKSLRDADAIILCVPTPLGPHNEPDLSYVVDSTRLAASVLHKGQLVVLESTTYPGTTRHDMKPILEATGFKCGEDFFLAYSPEREDPGRKNMATAAIPKLVGGVDDVSTDLAMALYSRCINQVHRVSSAEVAEMSKLLENIYRAVNIALVNELKVLLNDMGIDVWEVISAASTKPFGFQAFYPGPGLGGHCIPIDPFYLTWKAREIGHHTRFIELAGEINRHMPQYVVNRVASALNEQKKSLRGSKILIIGIAYKPNVDDTRETPAAEIIELLHKQGADVSYHDPHCPIFPRMRAHHIELKSQQLSERALKDCDCVLVVTDHDAVEWGAIAKHSKLIVDSRNAIERFVGPGKASGTLVKA
ncbi:MAG: nucleotide sugar dehydrogenase [Phycisphaerales bacterium]|nr:nucleotide sugar dehydrogenase [Phycisphaerales bacterium]